MKSGDITGVTGVPELTWCYNCNNAHLTITPDIYFQLPLSPCSETYAA